MAEKEQLLQLVGGMRKHLSSLDDLYNSAMICLAHTQDALATATANAKTHGEALSEVERQRYAGLIREAQENVNISVSARESFHLKLRQLEERIAKL